jgi:hypothetical protein
MTKNECSGRKLHTTYHVIATLTPTSSSSLLMSAGVSPKFKFRVSDNCQNGGCQTFGIKGRFHTWLLDSQNFGNGSHARTMQGTRNDKGS